MFATCYHRQGNGSWDINVLFHYVLVKVLAEPELTDLLKSNYLIK